MEGLRFMEWSGQDVNQVAVVPYRFDEGDGQICLITASSGKWTFPKGCVKSAEGLKATAEQEAWEEAGVRGAVEEEPFGCCELVKGGTTFRAALFLMQVATIADKWPEKKLRRRIWVGAAAAASLLELPSQHAALDEAWRRIEWIRAGRTTDSHPRRS